MTLTILACLIALSVVASLTAIGGAVLALVAPEDRPFYEAARPVIGLATLALILDLLAFVLPLRIAGLVILPLTVAALWVLHRRRAAMFVPASDAIASIVGVVVAAIPVLLIGRVTVAALTNDDATYYVAVADQMLRYPWLQNPREVRGLVCLSEVVIHGWLWRTGVPHLLGTIATIARVTTVTAVPIVVMVLTGVLAHAGIALSLAFGAPDRPRSRALAGSLVVVSAAPVFLAWQHLIGQVWALSLFPIAIVALCRAIERGRWRPMLIAGLLLGGAMNGFADAAVPLLLAALPTVAFGGLRGPLRLLQVGAITVALFPLTVWRAAWALFGTLVVRPRNEPTGVFRQRGWLVRTPFDDLATLIGVDPWPPWPAAWPAAILEVVGVVGGLGLLGALLYRERRRRAVMVSAACTALVIAAVMIGIDNRYVRAKWLLLESAIVVPALVAAGLSLRHRAARAALVLVLAADVAAIAHLARPAGFHVVDAPDHDQLVQQLALVPPGSLLVLDGFGAPADVVHDEHRAFRAAQRNGVIPIQPGLDGGFYRPTCAEPRVDVLPREGWALQRDGVEQLSGGAMVARFGRFTLRRADLTTETVGAWAPTHGFLRAEVEPDGTVFRWGERTASGVLRIFGARACGRLHAEVRSVSADGMYSLLSNGQTLAVGALRPKWAPLASALLSVNEAVSLELRTVVVAPDDEHAIALRKLAFVAEGSCVVGVARDTVPASLPEPLTATNTYSLATAIGIRCGRVIATLESDGSAGVELIAGDATVFRQVEAGRTRVTSLRHDFRRSAQIQLRRTAESEGALRVVSFEVQPESCEAPVQ